MNKNTTIITILVIIIVAMGAYIVINKNHAVPVVTPIVTEQPVSVQSTQTPVTVVPTTTPKQKTVYLTDKNNNQTETVSKGDDITITLGNPGDGGYQFDDVKYDKTVLSLKRHVHADAVSGVPGDAGNDVWEFIAIKSGASKIDITASQPFQVGSTTGMFFTTVVVN